MRSPSPRVLANRCTVYPYVPAQDADAGNDPDACYPAASAVGIPCSHQCESSERADEFGQRVTTANAWTVVFARGAAGALKVNDRVDLLNPDGTVLRSVYVAGALDMASRGSADAVPCVERV